MADRFPGGVISKTPPTVVAPVDGEGGSASGMWTLDEVLGYQKAGGLAEAVVAEGVLCLGQQRLRPTFGDDTVVNRSSPVQIGALTNWSSRFRLGRLATRLAVKTDGTCGLGAVTYRVTRLRAGMLGDNDTILLLVLALFKLVRFDELV
jgi:hypothetical protein